MLSVLIPIYNFDVRAFVADLSEQAAGLEVDCEIICLDDASKGSFRSLYKGLDELPFVRYLASKENLGRSKVRNRLEEEARFDNLLFLDCDGKVVREDYLHRYVQIGDYDVVYGGREYPAEAPKDLRLLFHWTCGKQKEEVGAEERRKLPYKSFMTNNFMVRREVYQKVRMDENMQGYGHEDTLFAMELKQKGFTIMHIDNPLEHLGIEPANEFLRKSANGVANLAKLMANRQVDDSIKLVRTYQGLKSIGLIGLISRLITKSEPQILENLNGETPNLLLFDMWKLAKLHRELKTNS
ncbi:MAG: glycosyltransferase [Cryomorphaceae bacterium]